MFDYLINDYFKNIAEGSYQAMLNDFLLFGYVIFVFCRFSWNVKGILRRLAEFAAMWGVRLLLSSVIYMIPSLFAALEGYNTMYVVYPLVLLFYLVVFSKEKVIVRSTRGIAFYALYVLSFSFSYDVMMLFGMYIEGDLGLLMIIVQICCMILICVFLRHNELDKFSILPIGSVILIDSFGIIGVILCFAAKAFLVDIVGSLNLFVLLFHFLFFFIEIVGYKLFYHSADEMNKRLYSEIEKRMSRSEQSILSLSQANLEQLRKLRHDMKNQYGIMSELLERKEYGKLREYFSEYVRQIEQSTRGSDSGNKIVDCLMNAEYSKARDADVEIDARLEIPHELPFEQIDLCALLFNVLDNAIEAVGAFEEKEKRLVTLRLQWRGAVLTLRCVNPVNEKELNRLSDGNFHTNKSETGHGYGLKIIRDIVKKYDGEMEITVSDGNFVVDIMLQTQEKV